MVSPATILAACDGYGGFELALRHLGLDVRTVCRIERDSYAAAVLVERMAQARLDQAPVWSDLATFDGRPWCGLVDIITAGLPCQPFSSAGRGDGIEDERHLWPHLKRIIEEVRPGCVFLENVPQVISKRWLDHVLADLAEMGFDAEWGCLGAAEVGATHRRERFWLVAHANRDGLDGFRLERLARHADGCDETGTAVADPNSHGRRGQRVPLGLQVRRTEVEGRGTAVADTCGVDGVPGDGPGPDERQGRITDVQVGGPGMGWPPGPDGDWTDWLAAGGSEPVLRRRADGPPGGLADALHLGGNGLVPQAAAAAFTILTERLREP